MKKTIGELEGDIWSEAEWSKMGHREEKIKKGYREKTDYSEL